MLVAYDTEKQHAQVRVAVHEHAEARDLALDPDSTEELDTVEAVGHGMEADSVDMDADGKVFVHNTGGQEVQGHLAVPVVRRCGAGDTTSENKPIVVGAYNS